LHTNYFCIHLYHSLQVNIKTLRNRTPYMIFEVESKEIVGGLIFLCKMIKQIKNTKRFFISSDGFCFKVDGLKEIPITTQKIRGIYKVRIENQRLSLLNLMIEYFIDTKEDFIKPTFKFIDGKMPLKHIKLKEKEKSENEDFNLIVLYKCEEKASAANCRVKHTSTISANDVINSLKRTGFKCTYCGDNIKTNIWHLDHVTPLSTNGINTSTNITPACKTCNLMKGAIDLTKFLNHCNKITKHNDKHSNHPSKRV